MKTIAYYTLAICAGVLEFVSTTFFSASSRLIALESRLFHLRMSLKDPKERSDFGSLESEEGDDGTNV